MHLNANGDMTMSGSGKSFAATYNGDVSLSDVRMIDKLTNDRFAGWKLLGLTNLKASYSERGTDVEARASPSSTSTAACCSIRKGG